MYSFVHPRPETAFSWKERSKSHKIETHLKQGYETLIIPPVLIPEGLGKAWTTSAQEEEASHFIVAGTFAVLGASHSEAMLSWCTCGNHTAKVAAAKGGAQAESKWQGSVQTRTQMTCTVLTNILNSSLGKECFLLVYF